MEIQYIGEHLAPGILGHLLTIVGFVTALLTVFAYVKSMQDEDVPTGQSKSWKMLARGSYYVHALSIVSLFFLLFFIIKSHYFEYFYAWKHSSTGLRPQYLFSAFWEGSEGSFLLWTTWNAVWGIFLMRSSHKYESRVMVVLAIVQAALCTLQLGAYIGDIKIGSNAFNLLREEMAGSPIFSQPDYLSKIEGNGLNPLLQNYWMVIHPPVLFCGFSLMLFPFTYAIAALWKGEYKEWVRPALRWSLAAGGVLGLGIMMGGAWAYESLTFGGYWAWDPVENASLVPWLVMIAAIHTLLIYKSTGRSLKTTFIFIAIAYVLIWYSTFLTRTGILGETSVHSFTGEGSSLTWHLVTIIAIVVLGSAYFVIKNWRRMPQVAGEEEGSSRDFWMLIGSVFLFLSALVVIAFTSQPVIAPLANKITGKQMGPPTDPVAFYNSIEVWFGIIIGILTAFTQFLKYKTTNISRIIITLIIQILIAAAVTAMLCIAYHIAVVPYILFLFSGLYAFVGNLYYLVTVQKKSLGKAGGSMAHIGFGIILVGILFSSYKKQVISMDATGHIMDFGKKTYEENLQESRENVQVFRNSSMPMADYWVTYLGDSMANNDPPITYFKVRFDRRDPQNNQLLESFTLLPDAYMVKNGQMGTTGLSSNPHYKRYWNRDIFTYISSMSDPAKSADTSSYRDYTISEGDSIYLDNGYVVFKGFDKHVQNQNYRFKDGDVAVSLIFNGYDLDHALGSAYPVFCVRGNQMVNVPDTLNELGAYIRVNKLNPENKTADISIRQRNQQDDWIVLKVVVYPFIAVLGAGIVIMMIGFVFSWYARRERKQAVAAK